MKTIYVGITPPHRREYRCPQCNGEFVIYEFHADVIKVENQKGKCPYCGYFGEIETGTNNEFPDFIPLNNITPPWIGDEFARENKCRKCNTFLIDKEFICRGCGTISNTRKIAIEKSNNQPTKTSEENSNDKQPTISPSPQLNARWIPNLFCLLSIIISLFIKGSSWDILACAIAAVIGYIIGLIIEKVTQKHN
jgi:hypothetical protein